MKHQCIAPALEALENQAKILHFGKLDKITLLKEF